QRLVDRDLAQPAPERTVAAEAVDAVDHLEHRVPQHLERLLAIAADAQRKREYRPLEPAIDLFERRPLTGPRAHQQRTGHLDGEARRRGRFGRHVRYGCGRDPKRRSRSSEAQVASVSAAVTPGLPLPSSTYTGNH